MSQPIVKAFGGHPVDTTRLRIKQEPCTLHAFSHAADVEDADLVLFWLTPELLQVPSKSEVQTMGPMVSKLQRLRLRLAGGRGYFQDEFPSVMNKFMAQIWTAVIHGAVAVFIIPDEYFVWSKRTGFELGTLFRGVKLRRAKSARQPELDGENKQHGDMLDRVVQLLMSMTREWIFIIGMGWRKWAYRERTYLFMLTGKRADTQQVIVYPGAVDRQGRAKSLVLRCGAGGCVLTPPCRIKALLDGYQHAWAAAHGGETTRSGHGKIPVKERAVDAPTPPTESVAESERIGNSGVRSAEASTAAEADAPSPDAAVLDLLEKCREAKAQVEAMLKGVPNPMIGESAAMLRMYPDILEVAKHPKLNVVIFGETGTGKEVLLDLLRLLTDLKAKPFEIHDMAAITDPNTILSKVFGHVKGAYNGAFKRDGAIECAKDGTLVLDNLQNAPREFFAALLRVLEPKHEYTKFGSDEIKKARCRFIYCFNKPPEKMVDCGQLPEDWRRRFDERIDIPPLRDRLEDIPALVAAFVQHMKQTNDRAHGIPLQNLMPDHETMSEWQRQPSWSGVGGNVGGLRVEVERYVRRVLSDMGGRQQKTKPGRKPGDRKFSEDVLVGHLLQVIDDPTGRTVTGILNDVDRTVPSRMTKLTRTRDAVMKMIGRVRKVPRIDPADDDAMKEWRKKAKKAVRQLLDFNDLP